MSNPIKGFIVTLKKDMNDEDAKRLQEAIKFFHGIASVKPIESGWDDHMNRQQIKLELAEKLWEVLK